ncbi:hypothetical protein AB4527_00390 [Vibrio breoganii]|uniref:hypothetical protein n=1 Tax=Vibrio breoganii TaxID=553239 RepID=UPI000303C8E2|nr:hypothetical protein [Vibrio breoganii]OEF88281.1 hypothetical protein B003_00610 [Vibrio breoganii 1C10]
MFTRIVNSRSYWLLFLSVLLQGCIAKPYINQYEHDQIAYAIGWYDTCNRKIKGIQRKNLEKNLMFLVKDTHNDYEYIKIKSKSFNIYKSSAECKSEVVTALKATNQHVLRISKRKKEISQKDIDSLNDISKSFNDLGNNMKSMANSQQPMNLPPIKDYSSTFEKPYIAPKPSWVRSSYSNVSTGKISRLVDSRMANGATWCIYNNSRVVQVEAGKRCPKFKKFQELIFQFYFYLSFV